MQHKDTRLQQFVLAWPAQYLFQSRFLQRISKSANDHIYKQQKFWKLNSLNHQSQLSSPVSNKFTESNSTAIFTDSGFVCITNYDYQNPAVSFTKHI